MFTILANTHGSFVTYPVSKMVYHNLQTIKEEVKKVESREEHGICSLDNSFFKSPNCKYTI